VPLSISVEATLRDHHISSDRIESTLSYELIAEEIRAISKRHFHLVEKMAEHLAEFCLDTGKVSSVRVRIEKEKIFTEGPAGTEIYRFR
jgi:dihydroneopterin aldolase